MKEALYVEFGPRNQEWVERDHLRELKHIGKIQTYIKEFSNIMLKLRGMRDRMYASNNNIQPWEKREFMKQGV